jgi:hypothetical protein
MNIYREQEKWANLVDSMSEQINADPLDEAKKICPKCKVEGKKNKDGKYACVKCGKVLI